VIQITTKNRRKILGGDDRSKGIDRSATIGPNAYVSKN